MPFGRFRQITRPSADRGRRTDAPSSTLVDGFEVVQDDVPKDAFFASPLCVTDLRPSVEDHAEGVRVAFVATIRDAEGKRCPDVAVHASIAGPHRRATGMGHTSMLGTVTFRMAGPAGTYRCLVEDVAGGALGLDVASSLTATCEATITD